MNPLTNVKNITKLNETELATGSIHKKSWHDMYKESAWIFIGGLEYGLTEGDVIAVFSQYGEIENINLVRDKKTGKSKGYCFLCYSNQKSTILAVDNLNGIKLCNRTIRVDHVANYKPPKENEKDDEVTKILKSEGCAPQIVQKFASKEISEVKHENTSASKTKKKKSKKEKKKRKHRSDSTDSDKETHSAVEVKVKKEKHDPGYDKYDPPSHEKRDTNKKRHHEKIVDYSNGECSYSKENDRSKVSRKYFKRNDDLNKSKPKIKTELESDSEYIRADRNDVPDKGRPKLKSTTVSRGRNDSDIHPTSSKRRKIVESSFSSDDDEQTSNNRKSCELQNYRYIKPKKKSKNIEDSSSSSSDDASSTQSSSEDEKCDNRFSRKDKNKVHYENRTIREDNRDRSYQRDSYTSHKSKHYDKTEKHTEYSRTNYREVDRGNSSLKDSHYHKKKKNKY